MTCSDPELRRNALDEGQLDDPAWRAHRAACPSCRAFEEALRGAAAADPVATHPSGEVLLAFAEDRAALGEDLADWVEGHLAGCAECADALARAPRLGPARARRFLRPWPLAAAAGWLLALGLALLRPDAPRDEILPATADLYLSTPRGEAAAAPQGARLLRLHLLLPEDVPQGGVLHLRLEDAAGRILLERDERVREIDARDWPVLTLDREALPDGRLVLHVRTPSGATARFTIGG